MEYDFSGWATKNDLECGDGRTIKRDAFKDNDGQTVPMVWNHQHNSADNVLGHALLENRSDGVYAYCKFNNSESGRTGKELVKNGDVRSLSIYANKLKQVGGDVIHGVIREVSLVLAGANPGAKIEYVIAHSEEGEENITGFEASYDENIMLYHSDDKAEEKAEEKEEGKKEMEEKKQKESSEKENLKEMFDQLTDEQKKEILNKVDKKEKKDENEDSKDKSDKEGEDLSHAEGSKEKTVEQVINEMTEEQKNVLYALVGQALEQNSGNKEGETMKQNLFDSDSVEETNVLSHSDEEQILNMAKSPSCGSFQQALKDYANSELKHGVIEGEVLDTLFPDYKDVYGKEPETLRDDEAWVSTVIDGVKKLPFSRIRTRQLDARDKRTLLNAKGYEKGKYKKEIGNIDLLQRTTDPQTVYVKDSMHRDDIIDFTDFDIVGYQWRTMRGLLNKEIALAILVGDGRETADPDKISEEHIRPIWTDDELYVIHRDVDFVAARSEIQGTETGQHFGTGFVDSEAIIEASMFAREKYKGSGNLTFFCTPHLINVMLLAKDFNGRRLYNTVNDLKAALNVSNIVTVEQFDGLDPRKDADGNEHKMLGMFVNLADYSVGSTKGGEITQFEQFDIDFNRYKYLIETRCSGALTRVKSAIVLEEPVV